MLCSYSFFLCFFFLIHCFVFCFFFFFSSRRRHTRCLSDWSSDVCSSDLAAARGPRAGYSDSVSCVGSPTMACCRGHRLCVSATPVALPASRRSPTRNRDRKSVV